MQKQVKLTTHKTAKITISKRRNHYKVFLQFGKNSDIKYASSKRKSEEISRKWINTLPSKYKRLKIEFRDTIRTFHVNTPIPEEFLTKFQDNRFFDYYYTNNKYLPDELITVDADTITAKNELQLIFIRQGFTLSEATEKAKRLAEKLHIK
tara:strand:- start:150 stop:602 length:453 start_codon:yes stop_codon:yes gene_type:complete